MPSTPAVGVGTQRAVLRSGPLVLATLLVAGLWLSIGSGVAAAAPTSIGLRATYDARAHIEWAAGAMNVSSTATVTNTRQRGVGRLVFNLITLRTGAANIEAVLVGDQTVIPTVSGQTIIVPLPTTLRPGNEVSVTIRYRAHFNAISGDKHELFMKKDGIATAYRWIPWLSREQRFHTPNFGETWVTGTSPRVTVRLSSTAPLKFATSGRPTGGSDGVQTFEANDVRDFNFSMSPRYRVRKVTWNDVNIRVFKVKLDRSTLIQHARSALQAFSNRLGRYPYGRLTVAEVPAGTGMESPALIWISNTLGGRRLRHIVVHEVAHQWIYSAVGNNQGTQPFLDEGVTDFLTRDLLGTFRESRCPVARLDRAVYDYSSRCYPEVIYTQGANYLRRYRAEVGAEKFWAGLSRFYREQATRIAGTRTLLDTLDAETGFNSKLHAERFPSLYQ